MDSGALLTTCAGSGATLVAIIGGFLLTRYMAVEGEIRGADRSISHVKLRLAAAAERRDQAARKLTDYDIDEAFDSSNFIALLVSCFDNDAKVTVEHARVAAPLQRFADEDVARRLDAWRTEVEVARNSMVWRSVRRRVTYPSLRDLLRRLKVETDIEPIWRVLYESEKEAKRLEADSRGVPRAGMDEFDPAAAKENPRATYAERLHEAEVSFRSVQAEMRVAQSNRASIAEPVGLVWEVVVLGLVALLTIVPSLALLAPSPAALTRGESALVVFFFGLGLLLLVGYLVRWATKARDAWRQGANAPDLDFVIER